jgi:electron transfer flavoprotein beta subunit
VDSLIDACGEKAKIKVWDVADLGITVQEVGLIGSLTRVIKTFSPKVKREGEMLQGSKDEVIAQLVDKMHSSHLI